MWWCACVCVCVCVFMCVYVVCLCVRCVHLDFQPSDVDGLPSLCSVSPLILPLLTLTRQ